MTDDFDAVEHQEAEKLRERMADLLTRTANALKGEPKTLTMHSWHDLPEVAAEMARELAAWRLMMPSIDRLTMLLGVCEGVDPLPAAIHEIKRLRAK